MDSDMVCLFVFFFLIEMSCLILFSRLRKQLAVVIPKTKLKVAIFPLGWQTFSIGHFGMLSGLHLEDKVVPLCPNQPLVLSFLEQQFVDLEKDKGSS